MTDWHTRPTSTESRDVDRCDQAGFPRRSAFNLTARPWPQDVTLNGAYKVRLSGALTCMTRCQQSAALREIVSRRRRYLALSRFRTAWSSATPACPRVPRRHSFRDIVEEADGDLIGEGANMAARLAEQAGTPAAGRPI